MQECRQGSYYFFSKFQPSWILVHVPLTPWPLPKVSALPIYSSWCKVSSELLSSLGIHQSVCLYYHFTFWLSLLKLLVFFCDLSAFQFSIFSPVLFSVLHFRPHDSWMVPSTVRTFCSKVWFGLRCLTPFSTIFQLFCGV